jgi:hypothetical protein
MRMRDYKVCNYETDDEAELMEENLAIKEKTTIHLGGN